MNFQRSIGLASLLFLVCSLTIVAGAQGGRDDDGRRGYEGRWDMLGQSHVDGKNDHDRIVVNRRESYRALQFGIKGGGIEFQRVLVHFENGEDADLQLRHRIEDRGKTRVIDLPGNRRRIRSIEFWYSKEGWRSRPYVNVWGLR